MSNFGLSAELDVKLFNNNNNNNDNNVAPSNDNTGNEPQYTSEKKPLSPEQREQKFEQFKYVSENAKNVYIAMIVGIILSLIIAGLGGTLITKHAKNLGGILVGFGVFSALSFGWGIYATVSYSARCSKYLDNQKEEDPEEIDQSWDRTYLNIALFLMMIILLIFVLLSVACFAFQDQVKYQIKAMAQNSKSWRDYFGDLSYNTVSNSASTVMTIVGVVSLILSLFVATLLYFAFKMLGSYRTWQTVVEFVCIIFFQLGFVFLYLAIYAQKYQEVAKVEKAMPSWVPDALLGVAIVAIGVAIFGYVSAWTENKNYLKIFAIITGIYTIAIIVLAVGGALFAGKFKDYFENRCTLILDYINQDYLKKFIGCDRKYVFTSNNIDKMQCPKERIVTDWEQNLYVELEKQKEAYGCLDMGCCYTTYSFIKGKIDYLALVAFALFVFGCLLVGGSWYMLTQLELGVEEGLATRKAQYVLYTIIGIAVIMMVIFISLIPSPPVPSPQNSQTVEEAPKENTKVNAQSIIQTNSEKVNNEEEKDTQMKVQNETVVQENKEACGVGCLQLKYLFQLSSDDGKFTLAPSNSTQISLIKNEKQGNGWVVSFNGNSNDLNHYMEYFTFVHNCPLLPAKVKVNVTATAFNPNKKTSFIQLSSKMKNELKATESKVSKEEKKIKTELFAQQSPVSSQHNSNYENNVTVIDYSKLEEGKTYPILNKESDYSFIDTSKFQTVTGNVVNVTNLQTSVPLPGAKVRLISMDFKECKPNELVTDTNGNFNSDKLYVLKDEIPTTYKLEITSPKLSNYEAMFQVGGLGWASIINFGQIGMWDPAMLQKTTISSIVINSLDNKRLPDVNVTLWAGYKEFSNEVVAESSNKGEMSLLGLRTIITANVTTSTSIPETLPVSTEVSKKFTNKDGQFQFDNLGPNTYTVVFEKIGFYREILHMEVMGSHTKPVVTVQMTPVVEEGQIRFVLSWPYGPKDLDLHSLFKISRFTKCEVYFGKRDCVSTSLDTDNFNGGFNGVETITINTLGQYVYTFAVHKFTDISNGKAEGDDPIHGVEPSIENEGVNQTNTGTNSTIPDTTLADSKARVSVYISGYRGAILQVGVPSITDSTVIEPGANANEYNWWLAFCLNGKEGVSSITSVNKLSTNKPSFTYCEESYAPKKSFIQLSSKMKKNRN